MTDHVAGQKINMEEAESMMPPADSALSKDDKERLWLEFLLAQQIAIEKIKLLGLKCLVTVTGPEEGSLEIPEIARDI